MKVRHWVAATIAACAAPLAHGQNPDFDTSPRVNAALSNDTLQLRYLRAGSKVGVEEQSLASAGFFLSEDRDIVLSGGLLFPASLNIGRLDIRLGPQVYAALLEDENDDVLSATIGAEARLLLDKRSNLAIVGNAYYGPDILTFGSGDSLTDLSARAEVQVAEQWVASVGMRWFEFDLTEGGGERTLQDEMFVGISYGF